METSGETANLFVESDGEAICIGQIESRHAMRAITGVGGRVLLHSSGAGKVLLAHMETARLQRLLATMDLPRETPRTITDRGRNGRGQCITGQSGECDVRNHDPGHTSRDGRAER